MDFNKDPLRDPNDKVDENLQRPLSTRSKSQDNVLLSPIANCSHFPLNDINNTNPSEYVNLIGMAQKKWIESSKNWTVKDELQNAQLQWMREFSTGSKYFCTSTPQMKKNARLSLPFTFKSSSDGKSSELCYLSGIIIIIRAALDYFAFFFSHNNPKETS